MLNIFHYREEIEFSDSEPTPYANQRIVVFQVGTTTPAAVYSDADLTVPYANSEITTGPDGEVSFWSDLSTVDIVRRRGGARSTVIGDPGPTDELRFTRALYLR